MVVRSQIHQHKGMNTDVTVVSEAFDERNNFAKPPANAFISVPGATVHYIMQSIAILMLDISYDVIVPDDSTETILALKKLVRWLRFLRQRNGMAKRAYSITLDLLRKLANHVEIVSLSSFTFGHSV